MYQQINLYQPVFRKQPKVFSSLALLQISAVVLLVLALITVHTRRTLTAMDTMALNLEQQHQALSARMSVFEDGRRTPDAKAIDIEIEIKTLLKTIDQRSYLLEQFDQLLSRYRGGFASQFEALAKLQVPGLWIEGVTLNDDQHMEIRGMALNPEQVPHYLQQLEQRGDLSDTSFETVSITRIANDQSYIQFVLRNAGEGSVWQ